VSPLGSTLVWKIADYATSREEYENATMDQYIRGAAIGGAIKTAIQTRISAVALRSESNACSMMQKGSKKGDSGDRQGPGIVGHTLTL